ncbi:hypothetical protein ABC855_g4400 [[Candida] zeylanoides]
MSFLKDLIEFALPAAYADETEEETKVEESEPETPEESSEENDEAGDDEDDDDDDDEDDEDELTDPLDTLREECQNTTACKPFVHHFDECVERVTKEMEEEDYEHKAYKEDCVEEYFHLQHCINDCVAPKLFYKLK